MLTYRLDGREAIALRGYANQTLSDNDGGSIYNKFSLELRHPITLKGRKDFALAFLEVVLLIMILKSLIHLISNVLPELEFVYLCLHLDYWELILVMDLILFR